MKTLPLALIPLLSGVAFAADAKLPRFEPPFSFPRWQGIQPDLNLRGSVPSAPIFPDNGPPAPIAPAPVVTRAKPVSAMPIVVPRADLDPKMVKSPDPSIDYKILVVPVAPPPAK
jgi:hypothetical protein